MGYRSILFTLSIMLKSSDLISNVCYCAQINSVRIENFTNVRVAGKDGNVKLSSSCLVCIC